GFGRATGASTVTGGSGCSCASALPMAATAIKQPTVTFCVELLSKTPSKLRNPGRTRSVSGRNTPPLIEIRPRIFFRADTQPADATASNVNVRILLESVREHHLGLHSFRSMRRIEASLRKASALVETFPVLGQPSASPEPGEGPQRFGSTTKRWA